MTLTTTRPQLSSLIKPARDIMPKDADLDRLPQLLWVLSVAGYSVCEQRRQEDAAINYLNGQQAQVSALRALESLLPSVLDRAFKGEL